MTCARSRLSDLPAEVFHLTDAVTRGIPSAAFEKRGIDSLNIDDTEGSGERPAHSALLAAGIHVVEHLTNLGEVPASGATVTAVPPRIERFGTFPVRAFARVQGAVD